MPWITISFSTCVQQVYFITPYACNLTKYRAVDSLIACNTLQIHMPPLAWSEVRSRILEAAVHSLKGFKVVQQKLALCR